MSDDFDKDSVMEVINRNVREQVNNNPELKSSIEGFAQAILSSNMSTFERLDEAVVEYGKVNNTLWENATVRVVAQRDFGTLRTVEVAQEWASKFLDTQSPFSLDNPITRASIVAEYDRLVAIFGEG